MKTTRDAERSGEREERENFSETIVPETETETETQGTTKQNAELRHVPHSRLFALIPLDTPLLQKITGGRQGCFPRAHGWLGVMRVLPHH